MTECGPLKAVTGQDVLPDSTATLSHVLDFVRQYNDEAKRENVTMSDHDWLRERFEENRPRLWAAAYRMLGSVGEADEAVQESWSRLFRSDAKGTDFGCWLAMLIGRVCVDMLRFRHSRKARSMDTHLADVSVMGEDPVDPEQEELIADSVGLALGVVLDTLTPEERLAVVLHDMFGVRFEEIASIVGCSPIAARQITTRARYRIQGSRSFS
jgi:RNA polymerase sigma factor (sigma-70 family)